jgi:LDH2 family malate/lactate/ureidoglycolate dehydrogenase
VSTSDRVVAVSDAHAFARETAIKAGMDEENGEIFADSVVTASRRGIDTHGIRRIPHVLYGVSQGGINGTPEPKVVAQFGAVVTLDGDNGLGNVVGYRAMEKAVEIAREFGVGVVSVRNSNYTGLLSFHALRATEDGMIGFFTNDGPAVMAPWGGYVPALHNNPFSYALPTTETTGFPIVYDAACSAVARGKVRTAAARGESIPSDWAVDSQGRPTTDAHAALDGVILPMAAHKGYALATVLELLSAGLSGANLSLEVSPSGEHLAENVKGIKTWGSGHLAMAFNVEAFSPTRPFQETVALLVEHLRSCDTVPGVDRILIPGELEAESEVRRDAEGIPVSARDIELLDGFASEVGASSFSALV